MPIAPPALLRSKFEEAVSYDAFVELAAANQQDGPWRQRLDQLTLTPEQHATVAGFTRQMKVLCLTGTWCGDCALQGSAMRVIQQANPGCIDLRFLLRDQPHAELVVAARINDGFRVPCTFWLSEDGEPVHGWGDRSLSRYRSMAAKALPPEEATALGLDDRPGQDDPLAAVLAECVDLFERVHLLLRLSGRLRQAHGD